MLRRTPEISVAPVKLQKFSEYAQDLHVPSSLNLIKIEPLRGTRAAGARCHAGIRVVDNFFGGNGRYAKIEGREFTADRRAHHPDGAAAGVRGSARGLEHLHRRSRLEYLSSEINPHFANIVSPSEIVVVSRFKIELDGGGGELHVTMPYSMIEPIRDRLDSGMHERSQAARRALDRALREEIEEAEVELVPVLGHYHAHARPPRRSEARRRHPVRFRRQRHAVRRGRSGACAAATAPRAGSRPSRSCSESARRKAPLLSSVG